MDNSAHPNANVVAATVPGIDISHFQPVVNWAALAGAGFQYCFIKATDGTAEMDRSFATHWREARAAGLIRGAYHFFRPSVPAEAQAAVFLRAVGQLQPGDLPCVLDLESPDDWAHVPRAARAGLASTWLQTVERGTGVKPMVYLSPAFARDTLGDAGALARYAIWLAHYTMAESPSTPKPWNSWMFWQHGKGRVPGVSVPVDLNRFNGSREGLKAIAAAVPTSAP